jgi:mannose/fructose/N-acetylgalactosamine-specific phosphotransferase system component IIC
MLSAACGLFRYFQMFTKVQFSIESLQSFLITCILMFAAFGLPGLLQIFYQKDVALAMHIVRRDILTGRPESFKATHLSGICLILSVLMILMVFVVFAVAGRLSLSSSPVPGGNPRGLAVAFSAIPVFFAAKFLSVMFCYRNMKQARS